MLNENAIIKRMILVGKRDFPSFDPDGLKPEASIERGKSITIGLSSMDFVLFILGLETEFSCQIPDEVISESTTVGDIVKFLKANGR